MKRLVMILLCSVISSTVWAQTSADPSLPTASVDEERKAVAYLLSAVHALPSRVEFEKVSLDPANVLRKIAAGRGPIAERAVEAMFLWPDSAHAFAQAQLKDPRTRTGRIHRLLTLSAENFGDEATALVVPFFSHDDVQLRITAAAAVAKIRTAEAFRYLDAAIAAESNRGVVTEMKRYARRVL